MFFMASDIQSHSTKNFKLVDKNLDVINNNLLTHFELNNKQNIEIMELIQIIINNTCVC